MAKIEASAKGTLSFSGKAYQWSTGYVGSRYDNHILGLTATGGATYAWSNGATTASTQVCPTVATVYSVTVTGSNGCATSAEPTSLPPCSSRLPLAA